MFSIEESIKTIIRKENEALYKRVEQLILAKEINGNDLKPMTFSEACEYISCSKSYLYKMTSQNHIPHAKRGKRLYFIKNELDAWLLENKVKTINEIKQDVAYKLSERR